MSEDAELDDRPLSEATDPHGTAAAGEKPDNWHPADAITDAEREHNRRVYGVTYRERHGLTVHDQRRQQGICVTYCLTPGQRRRGVRCPCCYEDVEIRPFNSADIEAGLTRAERFAAWCGGWIAAFAEAVTFPFRVGRAHTAALVRDILQEAMGAGLRAEVDGLHDILTVTEALEVELRAIRNAVEAGE